MTVCEPCRVEIDRWYETKPSQIFPSRGFTFGSGAAYDATARGVIEAGRARVEKWRVLVKDQTSGIRENCLAGRHVKPKVDTSPSSL